MSSVRDRLNDLNMQDENNDSPIDEFMDVAKSNDNKLEIKPDKSDKLKNQFGVYKIDKPKKDSQASFRIPKETHDKYREIVKQIYYPQKPNYNETLNQILKKFIEEFEQNNSNII